MHTLATMLNLALCLHSWPPPILLTAARRLQLTTKVCLALFSIVSISVPCQRAFLTFWGSRGKKKNVFELTSVLNLNLHHPEKTSSHFATVNQLSSTFIYKSAEWHAEASQTCFSVKSETNWSLQSKQQIESHYTYTNINRHTCSKSDCKTFNRPWRWNVW